MLVRSFLVSGVVWTALLSLTVSTSSAQIGTLTCSAAANATGQPATLSGYGSAGVADMNFRLRSTQLPLNTPGFFLVGWNATVQPNPLRRGDFCIAAPLARYSGHVLSPGSTGAVNFGVDLTHVPLGPPPVVVVPGDTLHFQYWYRDPLPSGGATNNLSPGLAVTFHAGDRTYAGESFRIGAGSWDLASADFNEDGLPDLVSTPLAVPAAVLSILRNKGHGRFRPRVLVPVLAAPYAVATGDVDGDGHVDIAAALAGGVVEVLLGQGDGSFTSQGLVAMGLGLSDVALEDLDQDGLDDLLVVDGSSAAVGTRLALGTGGFGGLSTYPTGVGAIRFAWGDVNLDGWLDAVIVDNWSGSAMLALGLPGGALSPVTVIVSSLGTLNSVTLGDLNGDGAPEAALVGANGVSMLGNDGQGGLSLQGTSYLFNVASQAFIVPIDADLQNDLVVLEQFRSRFVTMHNTGNGLLGDGVLTPTGASPSKGLVLDVDGDGDNDVVTLSSWAQTVTVSLNRGDGTYPARIDRVVGDEVGGMAMADFDSDGVLELAVTLSFYDEVAILDSVANGAGGNLNRVHVLADPGPLVARDLVGGPRPDLAVMHTSGGFVSVYENLAQGGFQLHSLWHAGGELTALGAGRFGGADVLITGITTGAVRAFTPSGALLASANLMAPNVALVVVDVNGDGDDDVIALNGFGTSTSLTVLLGPGLQLFGAWTVPGRMDRIAAGDLDHDGDADIALLAPDENRVELFANDGQGTLVAYRSLPTWKTPFDLELGDVDADGRVDVLVAVHESSALQVFRNFSWAPLDTSDSYSTSPFPREITVGDLTGDGSVDVAVGGPWVTMAISILTGF